eukprot:6955533-Pyramimonas_sp.AAC.1
MVSSVWGRRMCAGSPNSRSIVRVSSISWSAAPCRVAAAPSMRFHCPRMDASSAAVSSTSGVIWVVVTGAPITPEIISARLNCRSCRAVTLVGTACSSCRSRRGVPYDLTYTVTPTTMV